MSETHKPRLPYRLQVALAVLTLRLLGAYLRIVVALCAACAWVKRRFQASRARMTEDVREELWW